MTSPDQVPQSTALQHPAPLDRQQIAARIPHAGRMCLLESVERWSRRDIHCVATSHRAPDNPLRSGDRLPISAGIEYAAQAMAVHGSLVEPAGSAPRRGYLVVLSRVTWSVERLDDIDGELQVEAVRDTVIEGGRSYQFALRSGQRLLLSGSAVIALDPL